MWRTIEIANQEMLFCFQMHYIDKNAIPNRTSLIECLTEKRNAQL